MNHVAIIVSERQIPNALTDAFCAYKRRWEIGPILNQIGFVNRIRSWRTVRSRLGPPISLTSFKTVYWLAAETGLRAGEIAGLELTDLDGERLTVSRSVWGGKNQSPKTNSSVRTLGLSPGLTPQLVSLLWEQIARQKAKAKPKQKTGQEAIEHKYLFTSSTGTPLGMDVFRQRKMRVLLKSLGIPQAEPGAWQVRRLREP